MKTNNEGLRVDNPAALTIESASATSDENIALRQQFIKDILHVVSTNSNQPLPMGIKPILSSLLAACDHYMDQKSPEGAFLAVYQDTLTILAQGWSSYSQWVAAEQITCYSIYWGLKTALEKHLHRQGLSTQDLSHENAQTTIWQKIGLLFKKISYFFHTYDFEYHQWGSSFKALHQEQEQDK